MFPVLEAAVLIPFNCKLLIQDEPISPLLGFAAAVLPMIPGILEVISGVFLLKGVTEIRKFYREKKIEDRLNTKTVVLHAGAFGLYLFVTLIGYTCYAIYVAFNSQPWAEKLYEGVLIPWYFFGFIAELLLCIILWDLIKKNEDTVIPTEMLEKSADAIVVEEFDQDAQVQARIWNKFMREPR